MVALDVVDVAENKLVALAVVAVEAALAVEIPLVKSGAATTLMGSGLFGLCICKMRHQRKLDKQRTYDERERGRVMNSKTPSTFLM